MVTDDGVRLTRTGDLWELSCSDTDLVREANQYLGYLADRNYSPRTIRTYGYGLLVWFPPNRGGFGYAASPAGTAVLVS